MSIYTIILPTFNDWKSLSILLIQIEKYLKNTNNIYKVLIIDDNSFEKNKYKLNKNRFFKEIKILTLKKNVGSQKAIATGLKFISKYKNKNDDKFIIMDSDGEDDPKKIKEIIKLIDKNHKIKVITMNRTIRKESFFFSILYEIHLLITFFITFKYIRFGNFSYLNRKVIDIITKKKELWLAYSATLNKYFNSKESILAPRRKRISGKSKMSYSGLVSHSINIQSVYMKNIFISYALYSAIFIFLYVTKLLGFIVLILLTLLIVHFLIIALSFKEKIDRITFNICLNNIKSIKKI
ncbi:MAG: glycosyltransferase [Candidatus Pelagibacter bacterium]|nr:glycosyltransferase [Candidatus Pelagibacter bacterium]